MGRFYELNLVYKANILYAKYFDKFFSTKEKSTIEGMFHYTTTEVLDKILENATFRATNIFYLNDSKEYKSGLSILQSLSNKQNNISKTEFVDFNAIVNKIMKDDGKSFPGLYTISFSASGDSLHQWITYAKESGVSIELDYDLMTSKSDEWVLKQELDEKEQIGTAPIELMKPVKYECELNEQIDINNIYDELIKNNTDLEDKKELSKKINEIVLRMVAANIKNDGFKNEDEIRITMFPIEEGKYHSKIKYFPMRGVLRPFIEVNFSHKIDNKLEKKIPIKSITIGPSAKQQAVFDSVVHRLKYGSNCIFQYKDKQLAQQLDKYIMNFKEWYKNYSDKRIGNVEIASKYIMHNWYSLNNEYSKKNMPMLLDDKEQSDYDKNESIIQGIVYEFNKNFYLTKEGILIKKSNIPYIF